MSESLNRGSCKQRCTIAKDSGVETLYFVLIGYRHCSETRPLSSQRVYSSGAVSHRSSRTAVQFSSVRFTYILRTRLGYRERTGYDCGKQTDIVFRSQSPHVTKANLTPSWSSPCVDIQDSNSCRNRQKHGIRDDKNSNGDLTLSGIYKNLCINKYVWNLTVHVQVTSKKYDASPTKNYNKKQIKKITFNVVSKSGWPPSTMSCVMPVNYTGITALPKLYAITSCCSSTDRPTECAKNPGQICSIIAFTILEA